MRFLQAFAALLITFGIAFVLAAARNFVVPALLGGAGAAFVGFVILAFADGMKDGDGS